MRRLLSLCILLVAVTGFAQNSDNRWNKARYITVEAAPAVTVSKGKPGSAVVRFRVNPGFHVNSNKPSSDLLIPTEIKFEANPAVVVGKMEYPAGEALALSFSPGEKLSVYQGDVAVKVSLAASPKAKPGAYTLKGTLNYQACNDSACFPPKTAPFEMTVLIH